jgi:hypothetical protein
MVKTNNLYSTIAINFSSHGIDYACFIQIKSPISPIVNILTNDNLATKRNRTASQRYCLCDCMQ